eukprot:5148979-Ditylum_brightwellii.AAC.1
MLGLSVWPILFLIKNYASHSGALDVGLYHVLPQCSYLISIFSSARTEHHIHMRFTSFNVAALAAALLIGSTHAGFPDEDDGSLSRHLTGVINSDGPSDDDGDTIDLIVKYKNQDLISFITSHSHDCNIAEKYDIDKKGREISRKHQLEAITIKKSNLEDIQKDPDVRSVEFDYKVHILPAMHSYDVEAGEGEPRLLEDTPYGIDLVNPAPRLAQGNNKISVCVVDTGYDNNHEDLPHLNSVDGFSSYPGQYWSHDGHGHGSHCAGTIGAIGGNEKGVTSVNPDPGKFSFFIGKGLTDNGWGTGSGVLAAVQKCVDKGAKIISMSLGGGDYSSMANDQYSGHYEDDGVLIIAAAGNSGNSAYSYPASYASVMSVAAVDSNKNKAIAGPGVSIQSTIPGNKYASWSGTSMAAPHVAGVAALVWSHFPNCSNKQIREALIASAQDLGADGCDHDYGFGLVDAKGAYDFLSEKGCNFPTGDTQGGCYQCEYLIAC